MNAIQLYIFQLKKKNLPEKFPLFHFIICQLVEKIQSLSSILYVTNLIWST